METLKPCPWCNYSPTIYEFNKSWFITCTKNKAHHNVLICSRYKKTAIKQWNTRAKETTNGN